MASFLIAILLIGVVAFVVYPLFKGGSGRASVRSFRDDPLERLLSEKESALAAIRDLDFDYKMGKLSEEDYRELRGGYRAKALSLLREIDEMGKGGKLEDQIEREISALRKERGRALEKKLVCPKCGAGNLPSRKFCSECGSSLRRSRRHGKS